MSGGTAMPRRSRHVEYVMLVDGADRGRITKALQAVAAAEFNDSQSKGSRRTGDALEAPAARKALEQVEEEAATRAEWAGVTTLPRRKWRDLKDAHPPRPGDESDEDLGYNAQTFPDAVVEACLVEPEFTSSGERDEWFEDLTEGESMALFSLAYGLNEEMPDPKASRPDASDRMSATSE